MNHDIPLLPLEPHKYLVQPMTLRDYFAGQAMAGGAVRLLGEYESVEKMAAETAKVLYIIADAMLAERNKP